MKRSIIRRNFAAFTILILLSSCIEDEERPSIQKELPYFDKINVAQNIEVHIRTGEQQVEIIGDGPLDMVVAEVVNEVLNIYNPNQDQLSEIEANIWVEDLSQLICRENSLVNFPDDFSSQRSEFLLLARNSARVRMERRFTFNRVYFGLRDASQLEIASLESSSANVDLRNNAQTNIQGNTTNLNIVVNDGANFNLGFTDPLITFEEPIRAEYSLVSASNDASAWVFPIQRLEVNISDGSTVYYKGEPNEINENISNGGQLIRKDE